MHSFKKRFKIAVNNFVSRCSKGAGFTFIEVLVVITISLALTTMLVGYTRTSERQIIFFKEHSILVNALFRAKSFALETFQPELTPGFAGSGERVCGWGVHFDLTGQNNRYILYRDIAPGSNPNACSNPSVGNFNPSSNNPEAFEVFELDTKIIKISCLRFGPSGSCSPSSSERKVMVIPRADAAGVIIAPGGGGGNIQQLDVFFLPPDPQVIFHPSIGPSNSEAVIVLELADGSRKSEIKINKAGQISFDE